jgi:hypothetical protein
MAFATISSVTKSRQDSDATSSSASYPATVASGDLAVLLVGADGSSSSPDFSGTAMTEITSDNPSLSVCSGSAYKFCDGTEDSSSETWDHGTAQTCSMMLIIVGKAAAIAPEGAHAGGSSTNVANPPSLSPSWGSDDNLWLAFGVYNGDQSVSSWPTNYDDNQQEEGNSSPAGVSIALCSRENAVATEDPGGITFTSGSVVTSAITLAIQPQPTSGALRLNQAQHLGWNSATPTYQVFSGSNRVLLAFVCQCESTLVSSPTLTWGGQSMTSLINRNVETNRQMTTFYLLESGIAAASGSSFSLGGGTPGSPYAIVAAAFENIDQSAPSNTLDAFTTNAANPISGNLTSVVSGSASVACALQGDSRSSSWGSDLTERTDDQTTLGGAGGVSLADSLTASGTVTCEDTWSAGVFRCILQAVELAEAAGASIPIFAYHHRHNIGSGL